MTFDLDDLERKARAATPGPWWMSVYDGSLCSGDDGLCALAVGNIDMGSADTEHVMANSPDVTLDLIARVRTAEADAAKWRLRAAALLRAVGGDTAGRLVRLLDERGHGALDPELRELLDQLRPVVC